MRGNQEEFNNRRTRQHVWREEKESKRETFNFGDTHRYEGSHPHLSCEINKTNRILFIGKLKTVWEAHETRIKLELQESN